MMKISDHKRMVRFVNREGSAWQALADGIGFVIVMASVFALALAAWSGTEGL